MKILIILLVALVAKGINLAPLPQEEVAEELSLATFDDEEIIEETRRRLLGGPWSPEDASSILNMAIDIMFKHERETRNRRFSSEASQLLNLLTDSENPQVQRGDIDDNDPDYMEDPFILPSGKAVPVAQMQRIIDMHDGTNGQTRRNSGSIEKLYPWYFPYMLPRFRERLQNGGNRLDKLRDINEHVFALFRQARESKQPVHGRMLQRWARQRAVAINLNDFLASESWLKRFKVRNGIVSRKVTSYTGRAEDARRHTLNERIENFRTSYTSATRFIEKDQIWNMDQTGFNYEPGNLRTLSHKGERDTYLQLNNKNKNTHSYTLQPMISRDGQLYPKVLLVLQETDGVFGPRIAPRVRELERLYPNIQVFASRSGKLNTTLTDNWYKSTLAEAAKDLARDRMIEIADEPAMVLLADSWSGHSAPAQQQLLKNMGVRMLKIPALTTDRLQPLDVNFNRQLKIFYNRVMEEAFYNDILPEVTSRDGIINLQSLMHNQLSSPVYRDMIKFAWRHTDPSFNASEITVCPPKMVNAIQFEFDSATKCSRDGCEKSGFIKCSHCGKIVCLEHFLNRTCFHDQRAQRRTKRSLNETSIDHENPSSKVDEIDEDTESVPESESHKEKPKTDATHAIPGPEVQQAALQASKPAIAIAETTAAILHLTWRKLNTGKAEFPFMNASFDSPPDFSFDHSPVDLSTQNPSTSTSRRATTATPRSTTPRASTSPSSPSRASTSTPTTTKPAASRARNSKKPSRMRRPRSV